MYLGHFSRSIFQIGIEFSGSCFVARSTVGIVRGRPVGDLNEFPSNLNGKSHNPEAGAPRGPMSVS